MVFCSKVLATTELFLANLNEIETRARYEPVTYATIAGDSIPFVQRLGQEAELACSVEITKIGSAFWRH